MRGNVDNYSLLLRSHHTKCFAATEKCATQIYAHHLIPGGCIHFNKRANGDYSRAIDQDIDPPIACPRLPKERLYVFFSRDVAGNGKPMSPYAGNRLQAFVEMRARAAEEDNPRPFLCEEASGSAPHASPRSRNNSNFIFYSHEMIIARFSVRCETSLEQSQAGLTRFWGEDGRCSSPIHRGRRVQACPYNAFKTMHVPVSFLSPPHL